MRGCGQESEMQANVSSSPALYQLQSTSSVLCICKLQKKMTSLTYRLGNVSVCSRYHFVGMDGVKIHLEVQSLLKNIVVHCCNAL